MDGRGGECCIARYPRGAYDNSKIDRIMLRFRPIAPKPVSSAGGTSPGENEALFKTSGRVKRKYIRDNNNNNNNKRYRRKRRVVSEENSSNLTLFTLPLLPEKPEEKLLDPPRIASPPATEKDSFMYTPIWQRAVSSNLRVLTPRPVRPVGSCVIVECLTDTCTEEMLGSTDEEKKIHLEKDTCPGFISDGCNRVRWTNEAYGKMLNQDRLEGEARPEIVWLVMKERVPDNYTAFACRVRLQYTCRKERITLTVPCDVWKMEGGGFAWRLDVKAALSLGR
ncbi:hypothetical protein IFM89_032815 [Coptis chinensis]|uniref:DUF7950 domain-containing protein n=1 Tax=Coptis chinensis TaxID=261450 RepID=A0A835LP63_9MAGN|nr:hypothetical protein IFM89_032815 [Coptis chinensis]